MRQAKPSSFKAFKVDGGACRAGHFKDQPRSQKSICALTKLGYKRRPAGVAGEWEIREVLRMSAVQVGKLIGV